MPPRTRHLCVLSRPPTEPWGASRAAPCARRVCARGNALRAYHATKGDDSVGGRECGCLRVGGTPRGISNDEQRVGNARSKAQGAKQQRVTGLGLSRGTACNLAWAAVRGDRFSSVLTGSPRRPTHSDARHGSRHSPAFLRVGRRQGSGHRANNAVHASNHATAHRGLREISCGCQWVTSVRGVCHTQHEVVITGRRLPKRVGK